MIAIRSCISCKNKKSKEELLRIVTDKDKNAVLDEKQIINKRAIYLCKDEKCIENMLKLLNKNKIKLKIEMNYDSLVKLLESLKF